VGHRDGAGDYRAGRGHVEAHGQVTSVRGIVRGLARRLHPAATAAARRRAADSRTAGATEGEQHEQRTAAAATSKQIRVLRETVSIGPPHTATPRRRPRGARRRSPRKLLSTITSGRGSLRHQLRVVVPLVSAVQVTAADVDEGCCEEARLAVGAVEGGAG
jgi:hypothetical protein